MFGSQCSSRLIGLCLCAVVVAGSSTALGQYQILHHFQDGTASNGSKPYYNHLVLDGTTLYGTTYDGGAGSLGTIFRINTNGTGFEVMHSFTNVPVNTGFRPFGGLTLVGDWLYGLSGGGGPNGSGVVYRINKMTDAYQMIYDLGTGANDAGQPYGHPQVSGDVIYGMGKTGGANGLGSVFKVNTNGTGYQNIHSFSGGDSDGASPWGAINLYDGVLYGMTRHGGDDDKGTLFKVNPNGTGYTHLHEFGFPPAGQQPFGMPYITDDTIYGLVVNGGMHGSGGLGIMYRSDIVDGSGYQIIRHFNEDPDPHTAHGYPIMVNGKLYALSLWGGPGGFGALFEINPDGSDMNVLHSWDWDTGEMGIDPYGSLVYAPATATFFGTTYDGGNTFGTGSGEGDGVLFAFTIPEPATLMILGAGGIVMLCRRRAA